MFRRMAAATECRQFVPAGCRDIISRYLKLGDIRPLAKAGVEQMLEYIVRHQLPLTADNLLTDLLLERSGVYVSGFRNTRLIGKDRRNIYTAEGIYNAMRNKLYMGHCIAGVWFQ
jgi:hypothetical protein